MVLRDTARQPSTDRVPSGVALLHLVRAPKFGDVGSVPLLGVSTSNY